MNHSDSIAKLSEALARAQGVMGGASKDSSNPFFKSKYADLSAVWDACRKPLTDNGLSVVQTADFIPEYPEMVCIETILCHSSGEWIRGRLAVKPMKPDPQSVGSCITYLRRYSLQSMVGIAPEDDDGNAASGKGKDPEPTKTVKKKVEDVPPSPETPISTDAEKAPEPEYPESSETVKPASIGQVRQIQIIMKKKGITEREKILDALTGFCGRIIKTGKELNFDEANEFIKASAAEKASVDALTGKKLAPGPCPNREDKAIMTVKYCGECKNREGCPVWPV